MYLYRLCEQEKTKATKPSFQICYEQPISIILIKMSEYHRINIPNNLNRLQCIHVHMYSGHSVF